ncbi:hypothetical protein GGS21DRAFT_522828 [Xylaria nigripes]|nr:hypothetical protein GGS21DRAFT_522828 [Xylaria nigripes]
MCNESAYLAPLISSLVSCSPSGLISVMVNQIDVLGGMFTPEEKAILRSQNRGRKTARDALVVRLADAFTFRRVPRDRQIPFDCFGKVAVAERTNDVSPCQLPAMNQNDLIKAEECDPFVLLFDHWLSANICYRIMQCVAQRIFPRDAPEASSGVTVTELEDVLLKAQNKWTRDGKDRCLRRIIDSIPNYNQISKVVCIGLSEVAVRMIPRSNEMTVLSQSLAQHLAVVSMVDYLRGLVCHEVKLFAADWSYDSSHEAALKSIGFTVLNASYRKQEHFVAIDDNTMVISFAIGDFESILPIISEYARPVAFIYDVYDYVIRGTHPRPAPSPVWSEVMHKNKWVTIPGPPLATGNTSTSLGLPFYTESTGRMLDEYRIAMRLSRLDVTELANRFDLHPFTDFRPVNLDESVQKQFMGERSCLLVRR